MFHWDENELITIGAVPVAGGKVGHDTTSDRSEWVRQYTDWMESGAQSPVNLLRERSVAIKFPLLDAIESAPESIDTSCMVL